MTEEEAEAFLREQGAVVVERVTQGPDTWATAYWMPMTDGKAHGPAWLMIYANDGLFATLAGYFRDHRGAEHVEYRRRGENCPFFCAHCSAMGPVR